jgi:hypothetical protein
MNAVFPRKTLLTMKSAKDTLFCVETALIDRAANAYFTRAP